MSKRNSSIIVALGLIVALLSACETSGSSGGGGGTHTVRYEVTGDVTDQADMTFQNENGDTGQQGQQALPWTYSIQALEGDFLYISAQNDNDYGSVTCAIYVDGTLSESNVSSGAYAICTASGSL